MRRFFALALFAVGPIPLVAHNEHVILVSESTITELKYHSGYTARWSAEVEKTVNHETAEQDRKNVVKYTLTLTRPADDKGKKPISLYNLRLQGGTWGVTIVKAGPGITFYNSLADYKRGIKIDRDSSVGGWPILPAGAGAITGAQQDEVAMMKWDGAAGDTCTIEVYSNRKIKGPLSKTTKDLQAEMKRRNLEGHHSEPPPGTPGGEEGESSNLAR